MHLQRARAGSACSADSVPDDLPIPNNLTYAVVPSTSAPDKWMVTCCKSNPVHIVNTCWEWCEIPGDVAKNSSDDITASFQNCININGRTSNSSNGLEIHMAGAADMHPNVGIVALVAVVMAMMHLV